MEEVIVEGEIGFCVVGGVYWYFLEVDVVDGGGYVGKMWGVGKVIVVMCDGVDV